MKKRLLISTVASIFVMFTILSVNVTQNRSDVKKIEIMSRANAQVNPNCPTGCVERPTFCYCNGLSSDCWSPPAGSTLPEQGQ